MPSVNEHLRDQSIYRQVLLQRYSNGVVQKIIKLLNRSDDKLTAELYAALAKLPNDSFTVQRLNSLLKGVRDLNGKAYEEVSQGIKDNLLELVKDQADYQYDLFEHVIPIPVSISKVTPESVFSAAMARPFQISKDKAVPLNEYLAGLEKGRADAIRDSIRLGYINGQSIDQMVRAIRGTKTQNYADGLMEGSRRHVEGMVRTAVNHTSNFTQQRFYEANTDLVKGVQWVSTLDGRTSLVCASRDGKIYPVNSGPRPPAHINCLTGDTVVSTCGGVSNVYKRSYKGTIVDIVTKSGRRISITPNHPILTRNGWKAAGEVNCLDKIACVGDIRMIGDKHEDNVIAKFSDLFGALNVSSDSSDVTNRPTSAEDFHGDVTDSEVDVIKVNSFAWDYVRERFSENREDANFVLAKATRTSFFGFGAKDFFGFIDYAPLDSLMSRLGKSGNLFWGGSRHSCKLLLRSISEGFSGLLYDSLNYFDRDIKSEVIGYCVSANAGFVDADDLSGRLIVNNLDAPIDYRDVSRRNNSQDWLISNAEDLPDFVKGEFVDGIEFDDVVDVVFREDVLCHVYNLENKNNWYLANGIITHNCRSTTVPQLKSWRELNIDIDEFVGTRSSMDGQIPEGITFTEFLRSKSANFQDEILGPTRGRLFRENKIEVDKFTNDKGKVYSLNELRKRNAKMFQKAGL